MVLNFRTDRSGQTVQTQIRLLLKEQFDQSLHCLLFHLHVFIAPAYSKVRYRDSTFCQSVHPFVRSSVRPSVHNLCQGAYSVAVIAGSMKPCIVITLDTHFKKAP